MTAAEIKAAAETLARDPTGHTLKDAFRLIAELAAAVEERRSTLTLKKKP